MDKLKMQSMDKVQEQERALVRDMAVFRDSGL